jgi:hypothetical protein
MRSSILPKGVHWILSNHKSVGVEIFERDNYITQGCWCSLHSFKSSRGVGVEIISKENITINNKLKVIYNFTLNFI